MPSKLEIYMEKADAATLRLTEDYRIWTEFLVTAGRVYKYEFLEQAMIFAQRPDAIACAEYDLWKKRMRRYVWRGTTGIGLVSYSGSEPYVRFVFDVTDTGEKKGALYPDLWQYRRKHEPSVTAALESRFEVPGRDGIVKQLARIAVQLAEDRWDNYREYILSAAEGSFLEELDELNISLAFQQLAAASIAYTLMSRCGLGPKKYFEPEDFRDIPNFNTVPVITQLGQAVSEACGQVLRRIEAVMKNPPAREPAAGENAVRPRPNVQRNPKPQEAKAQEDHIGQKSEPPKSAEASSVVPVSSAQEQPLETPSYQAGDTVYLDGVLYQIDSVGLFDVHLLDPSQAYPVLRAEPKERFEQLLRQDSRNNGTAPEPPEVSRKPSKAVQEAAENYRITDDDLGTGGPKAKFRANIEAITTLHAIERESRNATPDEQEILSRYTGWGSLADAFDPDKADWVKEYRELNKLLSPDEYASAQSSVLNAHYTSPAVIKAMYAAIGNMGFKAGNILEPSCGIGNFFGLLPESMSKSKLYGVELDSITGRIAQQLYPNARIQVTGYENTGFPRDFFDLAVGNVPFGKYQVSDPAYNKLGFSVHNYFFAKALDQIRPGGVLAFVTSRFTLDSKDITVRKYLAERADLLGAIRLPNNAFKANAGTEVVSDIIFLQKNDAPVSELPEWVNLAETPEGHEINSYFTNHPQMVLGIPTSESTQYSSDEYTVAPTPGADLFQQLQEAIQYIRGEYQKPEATELAGDSVEITVESIPADPNVKNHSFVVIDRDVYYRENSIMVKVQQNATAMRRIRGMVELRDCVRHLIDLQMDENIPDSAIQAQQAELNRMYDAYTNKYGLINDRANRLAFDRDDSYYLLCSLEILDEDNKLKSKADMFTKRTIKQHHAVTHVDTASEALAVSIGERARVDLAFMAQLTGKPESGLIADLKGVIYKDPEQASDDPLTGWQTADEYLSGNVRRKLIIARRAAEKDPAYQSNVDALIPAQPKDLDASEIEVRLGATWIDPRYIQQFMYEVLNTPERLRDAIRVLYSKHTGEWQVTQKFAVSHDNIAAYTTYGTNRANAYHILEDSLNLRDVRIYDTVQDPDGKERRVLNGKETTLAAQKQQALRDEFQSWIWRDPERRQELTAYYNQTMNCIRPREYDGSHIVFSGINPSITLQPHQLGAIARVLYGGNTLLAHEVGAGKTFEMIASAMESKRLGLCHKSIFVVPNHLTEQTASEFLRLYPSANILVTTKRDFETAKRKKFCARIATGDYDAVIIGHSQFEKIPVSEERQKRLIQEEILEITEGIREVKASGGEHFTIKQLERTKRELKADLEKLMASHEKDSVITFEQLGVDRMFVDESDNYKNLFLYTKMRNVAGLSTSKAQKSSDMYAKCRYLDEITHNRGIVFATGTPISNSMTEMYTIQRYLQYDRLQKMGMCHFDDWASRFGETVTALELAPEGTGYRARTRFAKFFNLPELMSMFKEVADIKTADQLDLPTPEVECHVIASKPTEHQQAMVKELSKRAKRVHSGAVDAHIDNMLKITSDGRKLGLDQRIINPLLPDEPGTKVNRCVENILKFWREGEAGKLTQLVFSDISTPTSNSGFNIYDDIRRKLISGGMPPEQIAYIHDANSDKQKKDLFRKVNSGQVRVLIGSTQKMGAGTNVQERLIALHDLDCPWRPRDLTQRKGRIERRGNTNPKIHVFRYVTESTFDAYLWQTVENKQKFISQIMTSKAPVRSCEDVDEAALSYAEIKALCAGDPRIKERMELDVDVAKLKVMRADHQSKQFRLEDRLLKYFPEQIRECESEIAGLEIDLNTLAENPEPENGFAGMVIHGKAYSSVKKAGTAILEACQEITDSEAPPMEIGSYRGFKLILSFNVFGHHMTLQGALSYKTDLGGDLRGNITRLDNTLDRLPQFLEEAGARLKDLRQQTEAAMAEAGKPFPREEELRCKSARLVELDAQLNLNNRHIPDESAKSA